jgi:phage regulator Rha-like protein
LELIKDVPVLNRRFARELGIEHESFMKTINTRQASIEQYFGHLRFEIGTVTNSVKAVNQVKYCLLTEDQYIAIATLSRNTAKVVEVKMKLVKAFSLAKQANSSEQ